MYASYCESRDYTYVVTVPPVNPAVSLADVKAQLRVIGTAEDALLNSYIAAATDYAEKYTRRDFITRTYNTFRDCFPRGYCYPYGQYNTGFEILRSKLSSINSITYLVDGVSTTVPSTVYYNTLQNDYSVVLNRENQSWPTDGDEQLQSITIDFDAGYGPNTSDVPQALQTAISQIVAAMYANRGDCGGKGGSSSSSSSCDCESLAPSNAKSILKQYRIENL